MSPAQRTTNHKERTKNRKKEKQKKRIEFH